MKKIAINLFLLFLVFFLFSCAKRQYTPEEQAYMDKAAACSLDVVIAKSEAEDAWGRAQSFIGKFSNMKLKTVTDYVIQTYNPPKQPIPIIYGYSVTKTPMGDNVHINVSCIPSNSSATHFSDYNAHLLAYYIKTGELMPHLVNK
jgi:hypothetical protein